MPNPLLTVLRWGRAEYERGPLVGLPEGVAAIDAAGEGAPLEAADVLVVPSVQRVRAEHVPRLRRCRLVLTTTSGFDHVDVGALHAASIPCARLPLARRDAVVQTALGMLLSLARRFGDFEPGARAGRWERAEIPAHGPRVLGSVVVVGAAGVIGARMVEVLRALGLEVRAVDPRLPGAPSLDEALVGAQAVSLHCALNPGSRGLFGGERLARLAPGTLLVNTARGGLVDVDAAHAALLAGRLGGLGLDVFPKEPADLSAWMHPRAILLPHAAGWHPGLDEAIQAGIRVAVGSLLAGAPVPYTLREDELADATVPAGGPAPTP